MTPYTFHITLYDAAFFGAIFIGLTFILLLWFTGKANRAANRFLAAALLVVVLWIARLLAIDIRLAEYIPFWNRLPLQFSLALGPLIFFYVLKITRPEYKFGWKDLLHFIPVLLEQVIPPNQVVEFLAFISVIIYLYCSHRLIGRFYQQLQFNGGDRYRLELRWLHQLLKGFGLLWLLWIPVAAADYFYLYHQTGIHAYYPLYLLLAASVIWMAATSHLRAGAGLSAEGPLLKSLPPAELKQKGSWLKKAVKENRYYKDPELSLYVLAEKLGISPHELSRIINMVLKKSFTDFINEYRVREVIAKMQDSTYDHITLLGIAYESGFSSKATFNRTFKQITGESPIAYKTHLKKEVSSYNMRRNPNLAAIISHRETTLERSQDKLNGNYMFRNYLTIAWRNLLKNKGFPIINIFCLVIGLTFSLLIGVYISDQIAINSGIKNVSDQYVIKSDWKHNNMGLPITTMGPLAKTIKEEYPDLVENYYRFDPVLNIVSYGDKHFRTQMAIGDTTLVTMYGFPLLYGDPQRAFRNNQSAVITEKMARKLFGTADALDRVITIQTPADGQKHHFVITAVLKDLPFNTITGFTKNEYEVYLPMEANQYFQGGDKGDNWSNVYMASMIQLKHGVTAKKLEQPFASLLEKYQPSFVKGNLKIQLAPLRDYYLKDNNSSVQKMLTTLSLVTAFILILAIINFVNISVGTSAYRLKEIGLRKVFGSSRRQLIFQHLTEALVLTFTAGIMSLGFYELFRPVFNNLLNTVLVHVWALGLGRFALIAVTMSVVGVVAGAYPAFILSASNVISAVKGKMDTVKGGLVLRKTLLIVQFTVAIVVFISAITVSKQVSYFFTKDIGYNKDQVMIVTSLPRQYDSVGVVKMENIRSQFLSVPGVQGLSLSYDIPDGDGGGNINIYPGGNNSFSSVKEIAVDAGFAKVYGLSLVAGNFFNDNNRNEMSGKVVLNETAVKLFGWTSAIGKTIRLGSTNGEVETVVGVVKDFNLGSLKDKIEPLMIAGLNEPFTRQYRYLSVKVNAAGVANTIGGIQEKCTEIFPDAGFEYNFMDAKFQALYQSELQLKSAANVATVLSLLIVFSGIIGVVAFTLTKRTKEIAVRKILGAGAGNIIYIFLKEYGLLILLSNAIAWPLAWFISAQWLENYAYRFHQDATPYLFVCLFILFMAFILITVQCLKTAFANPVKSLRTE